MKHVVILQHRLLHYRTELFNTLRDACAERGVKLDLVHGQASRRELPKKDTGTLPWAHAVKNRVWEIGARDILWQPYPKALRNADMVILIQENRLLSNYPFLLSRLWSKRKVAYWGHGKNFQSDAPDGLRERWKNWTLRKVDWWFAYSEMTESILCDAGFARNKITVLENAIDTSGFKAQLASWSEQDVDDERARLGMGADAPVAVFCGSLYPDKRLDLIVEAGDLIHQQRPDFRLLVIGDGPSKPELEVAAKTRPWITLLGVQQGRQKALYFRLANVMFNPGLVGLHLVDAFCAGLVMVTTDAARHSPEIAYLKHGQNGLMTAGTGQAYATAVLELINAPHRLAELRAASLHDSERYTLENMVRRFADGIAAAIAPEPRKAEAPLIRVVTPEEAKLRTVRGYDQNQNRS